MQKIRRTLSGGFCAAVVSALVVLPAQTAPAEDHDRGNTPRSGESSSQHTAAGLGDWAGLGWRLTDTGTSARFRGLAPISRTIAWAAGTSGTVLRTLDGGHTWKNVSPSGANDLEFRDIEAFDAKRAVALSIGEGAASTVYRTEDGGATWTESFQNTDPAAFYDCMAFFDTHNGLAVSDPVNGKYRILATADGGRTWRVLPSDGMPPAQQGEASFAASGQCLVTAGPHDVWLATGGATTARVLHSRDQGHTWSVANATLPAKDPARGVFALAFRDPRHGLAVGGDFQPDHPSPDAAAVSSDGGASWSPATQPPPAYRSGVAWLPWLGFAALAVGPSGSDLTVDQGRTWHTFDHGSFDTVQCTFDLGCWAAGQQGRIARLSLATR